MDAEMKPEPLRPMHKSMRGSQFWSRPPARMSAIGLDEETKTAVTKLALSIFTDCINSGKTFQDTILAVYLSGLENGSEAARSADADRA